MFGKKLVSDALLATVKEVTSGEQIDSTGNQLLVGDGVTVQEGPHEGRMGTISGFHNTGRSEVQLNHGPSVAIYNEVLLNEGFDEGRLAFDGTFNVDSIMKKKKLEAKKKKKKRLNNEIEYDLDERLTGDKKQSREQSRVAADGIGTGVEGRNRKKRYDSVQGRHSATRPEPGANKSARRKFDRDAKQGPGTFDKLEMRQKRMARESVKEDYEIEYEELVFDHYLLDRLLAEAGFDAIDKKALKKKWKDREDQDIDNDGDEDESDRFLHKRRKAISKSKKGEKIEINPEIKEAIRKLIHSTLK